jgi:hypothetical protein
MERGESMLADAELEAASGGATIVGTSLESQQRAALQQKLTDIYRSNHPIDFQPHLP